MKKTYFPRVLYFIIAPFALLFVVGGVWLTWQAQKSNYNLGQGVDQVLKIISEARLMRIPTNADPRLVLGEMIQRLEQKNKYETVLISGIDPARENAKALLNPWGHQTRLYLYPSVQALRLEVETNAVGCRRLSGFYTGEASSVGLRRLDVLLDQTTGLWRLVYDAARKEKENYLEQAIRAACGKGGGKIVSLTFTLQDLR